MALQIRRGLESQRAGITPVAGELLYTTDEKLVYVGDGATAGGILLAGGGGIANIVSDTSPQLGGNLDVNGFVIVSTNNENINISPNGTGIINLNSTVNLSRVENTGGDIVLQPNGDVNVNSDLRVGRITNTGELSISPTGLIRFGSSSLGTNGNVYITRNSYSPNLLEGFTFAQHHSSPFATDLTLYRTRGTETAPLVVQNGDTLGVISFSGYDGANPWASAGIFGFVEGVPSTGNIPTKISFGTNNGSNQAIRAELSASGIWKVNSIQNLSGSTLTLTSTSVNIVGNMQLNAQGDLRFADLNSSNWVAFQAPATITTNLTWTLPATDGTVGQVLSTDGSGTLSWATSSGGSGLVSRTTLTPVTTSLLTPGSSVSAVIAGYKGYILYAIQTSDAAWVRLYSSNAAKDADSVRLEGTDPLPGAGVIAEIISTGAQTILITPGAIGFSSEDIPSTQIPCTITNKSGVTTTITVTLTVLQIEV
jgi:hypothetical protein